MSDKKIVLIDFDGVLHSYTSGWQGPSALPDPPVEYAIEWLTEMVDDGRFDVQIYSSRSKYKTGIPAMAEWLVRHGLVPEVLKQISFPTKKPAAFWTLDDRCSCFQGVFPDLDWIDRFRPWNKQGL